MKTTTSRLYQATGALFIALSGSAMCANIFGFGRTLFLLAFVAFFFIPKPAAVAGVGAIDMSALASELSSYANENKTGLFSQIVNSAMFDFMTPIADVRDQVPLVELLIGDILQPGAKDAFNPQASKVKFKSRYGKVRPGKADLQFTPTQIEQMKKSWLGLMDASAGKLDVYNFPFEAYIFSKVTESSERT